MRYPLLVGNAVERSALVGEEFGAADEDVEPAEELCRGGHDTPAIIRREVAPNRNALAAGGGSNLVAQAL